MILNEEQKAILEGSKGETMAKVMESVIRYGEIFGADKLVPITSEYNHLVTSFGLKALGPVYDLMDRLIKDGAIDFGNNELLKIHLLDVAIKVDNESRRQKIIKMNAKSHIDGIAAVLDALVVRDKWHNEIGDRLKNIS